MGINAARPWSALSPKTGETTAAKSGSVAGAELRINGVSKSFGEQPVLHELNLTIQEGQFVAVVGRSGCGKSTLLRLLAGLELPTAGGITIDGEVVNGLRESTTVMFQDSRLIPWKTVIDNVGLGLKGDWRPRAEAALRQVGLDNRKHTWPNTLSGGQKQRVALARALVRKPKLLLLDEPLSALDALTKLEMQQLLASLWGTQRFTTLLVTHDVNEAVRLADRILLIDRGRVALDVVNDIARPRQVTDTAFGKLEKRVLERIFEEQSN
ncbi:ATP-binding cassette domain-containing protein [Paenibacillus sp. MER TA 81-3]|uniref:ATP-binding cassette domain-containing protein n=1 Tax=Paenibacillus sp. MER TA 81-3 TaxID=2939573 RepID=UPI00203DD162|nr:ATP-binding cassette domain-containing protein [Paenibacillus sp. MER TA 81-3]MCM3342235.1 ATP-binding cassette domain-containing protein [Paenibacillus sp. MER TA 81-3]